MPRWLTISLQVIGATSAWLAGAIVVAWLTGRVVSDRYGWSQWLLWIPTPTLLPVVLLGLLGAARPGTARRRRRRIVLWCACSVAIVLYFSAVEHRFLRGDPLDASGLRLVHWNMLDHRYGGLDRHVEAMIGLDADITIISNPGRTALDPRTRQWMTNGGHIRLNWPFAVYSRLAIVDFRIIARVDDIVLGLVVLDATETLGRPIVLYLVDLPSDPRRGRATIARRARQLLDEANAPPPDIIVGDFNMTRGSYASSIVAPGMRNAFDVAGRGYGSSFLKRFPLYHIDNVMLGPEVGARSYRLHYPGFGWHWVQVAGIGVRD